MSPIPYSASPVERTICSLIHSGVTVVSDVTDTKNSKPGNYWNQYIHVLVFG